jgi:hypothetical protein
MAEKIKLVTMWPGRHRLMKNVCHLLSFLAVGLLCTGCWPLRITSSPGASGVLIDAQTRSPISGAEAVVCYPLWGYAEWPTYQAALTNTRPPQVTSDSDGRFFIAPERRWVLYHPMPELAPALGYLVVRRDGYEPDMIRLATNGTENVGIVLLKPITK